MADVLASAGPTMSEYILRVEKLENGYEVEVADPDILAANEKPKNQWKDPWKGYAFRTADEVSAFVAQHLDSLKPPPDADMEFASAFNEATKDD